MSNEKEWRDSLKPGDTFYQKAVSRYGNNQYIFRLTVLKRTATQIVMTDGRRYNKDTGKLIGGGHFDFIQLPPSDDEVREILRDMKEREILRRLQETDWREIDPAMRKRICDLLDEVTK